MLGIICVPRVLEHAPSSSAGSGWSCTHILILIAPVTGSVVSFVSRERRVSPSKPEAYLINEPETPFRRQRQGYPSHRVHANLPGHRHKPLPTLGPSMVKAWSTWPRLFIRSCLQDARLPVLAISRMRIKSCRESGRINACILVPTSSSGCLSNSCLTLPETNKNSPAVDSFVHTSLSLIPPDACISTLLRV